MTTIAQTVATSTVSKTAATNCRATPATTGSSTSVDFHAPSRTMMTTAASSSVAVHFSATSRCSNEFMM